MQSPEYVSSLTATGDERTWGKYVRASLIHERGADLDSASYYALCAAWAADDAKVPVIARAHRERAATIMGKVLDGDTFEKVRDKHAFGAQLVDVLRRAARWQEARTLAEDLVTRSRDPKLKAVLRFEIAATKRQDDACYTFDDVVV